MKQTMKMTFAAFCMAAAAAVPAHGTVSYIVDAAEGPERAKWNDDVAEDVLELADPFIGSGGTGHTTPAAAYPFGMVQPGPDTSHSGWEHCSAYQYGDKRIMRFSQNHLSGTGCSEFTDLGFMPAAGDPASALRRDYAARFDKATEKASPGYYAVTLACGTKVEATCTRHVSLFRFTFPKGKKASLLFDPSWTFSRTKSAEIAPMKERRVSGHVDRHGWPGHEYWFAWEVSAEPTRVRIVREDKAEKGTVPVFAYEFDAGRDNVVYLKVSLSRTSAEGARRNIDAEIPGWDFDGVLAANRAAWRGILARVRAKGTKEQLKALYTSVYHLCFQPNTISDVGEKDLYSTFSCWDTYRAAGPLYTILTPEYVPAFINSMLWHFDNNGHLPVWTLWGKDNQCMIGVHSVPMIVDAYLKGFGERGTGKREEGRGNREEVDWEKAWECVRKTLRENRGRYKAKYHILDKYGYYPYDIVKDESVSRLLESCYDDACAARMAERLGKVEDVKFFRERSRTWTKCFDPGTGFVRARDTKGAWRDPFDPYQISHITHCDYTEGNAFHWNWHVMQDPGLLVERLGGASAAVRRLEGLFNEDSAKGAGALPDVTGLIGQYCHGNEPSHHNIYFFSLLGRRDLAARYIREVMDTQYQTTPTGLCGNDDCGQMSAWYIFSTMGIYPFDPCGAGYVLGEAQIEEISIDVGGGRRFRVFSELPGEASRSVELNGRKLDGVVVGHDDIMKGGTLGFKGGTTEYDYVFDTTGAPELDAWTRQNVVPLVRKWYPKLVEMFPAEGRKASRRVWFRFTNESDAPAYALEYCVTMSRKWFKENPDDIGCIIHELFHVVQGGYHNAPDWLTEGIADYVRFYFYEPEAHGCDMDLRSKDARYDGMYRVSANFLDFVERRYPGVVKELDALCHQGKYKEETYWKKRTGKTVKELEKEWKSQGDGPFRFYRFCVDGTKRPTYCTQLSEIELLDANGKVIPRSEFELGFEAGSGAFGDGETPDKAVDGDVNTKWLDFRANSSAPAASRASVWLQFNFAAPTKLSGYRWYTANDFEERDPAAWRLLGSNDGVTWFVLNQVTYFKAASDRNKRAFSRRIDGGRR
ncbi:MAG: GH92 family glycosyl hydrolase [Kiritimatiellae bacterium]|nr:GH92 family glycosyl hydrolase [Kiritimatiellia bacterium]